MRFSQVKTLRVYKPASFWWEKRNTVVIFVRRLGKKCCYDKTNQEHGGSFDIFQSAKRLSYQQSE